MLLLVLVIGALVARRFLELAVSQRLERQAVERNLNRPASSSSTSSSPSPSLHPSSPSKPRTIPPARSAETSSRSSPHTDGSLLIVVGDVSGKGIAAAMLVAVLVGAIRTGADQTLIRRHPPHAQRPPRRPRRRPLRHLHRRAHPAGGVMLIANAGTSRPTATESPSTCPAPSRSASFPALNMK